ncbi:MAG: tRNA uridine-5-carboxymethylaminomethyl(34) synthesis GTPase MnmE [Gemmatimonadales bacterium]
MLSDTIVALATPSGRAALALIRISGEAACAVAARAIPAFDPTNVRRATLASVVNPDSGELLDRAVYVFYRAPNSFNGQDTVEVTTHGGLLVPTTVLAAFLAAGARLAEPGEFTRRAVLNGKMDLLQAEAIVDLVEATAPAQRQAALAQMNRGLSNRITALRSGIIELEALLAYDIDFPEEDDGPVSPERITRTVGDLLADIDRLLATAADGERVREGALAVIAGEPNVGKSSLFNALLGSERAIVTEIEGTTRDAIEAPITCRGYPFRLVDTAGLRSSDDRIEKLGIEVSKRYVADADVVLLCVEAGKPLDQNEEEFATSVRDRLIVIRTKTDLHPGFSGAAAEVAVSAESLLGIDELRQALAKLAFAGVSYAGDVSPLLNRERHRAALVRARDELEQFVAARRDGLEPVVCAIHLGAAVGALEEIVGVVTTEDVLDELFSSFCVGK